MYFFQFKIWRIVFFLIQNLTRNEFFNLKSCFLKKHENCKLCRFCGVKWSKTRFFECKNFFKIWLVKNFLIQSLARCIFLIQNLTRCKSFNSKSDALWKFCFKNWRVVFISIQNMTRCKSFSFKIWRVVEFFIQNLLFKRYFQIFTEILSKCYRHQRTTCWKMTTACCKNSFSECVACFCLTSGTVFLVIAFLMANGFLMGVITKSFALPIDLSKSLWNSEIG